MKNTTLCGKILHFVVNYSFLWYNITFLWYNITFCSTFVVYLWYICGIFVVYLWYICGIFVTYLWYFCYGGPPTVTSKLSNIPDRIAVILSINLLTMTCDCIYRFLSECFQIAAVPLPWWVVDLGATYKVVAVKLLNTVVNSKPSGVTLVT